jgi:hypothetical protein
VRALRRAIVQPGHMADGWAEPAGCGLGRKAACTLFILYSFFLILFSFFKIPEIGINF